MKKKQDKKKISKLVKAAKAEEAKSRGARVRAAKKADAEKRSVSEKSRRAGDAASKVRKGRQQAMETLMQDHTVQDEKVYDQWLEELERRRKKIESECRKATTILSKTKERLIKARLQEEEIIARRRAMESLKRSGLDDAEEDDADEDADEDEDEDDENGIEVDIDDEDY